MLYAVLIVQVWLTSTLMFFYLFFSWVWAIDWTDTIRGNRKCNFTLLIFLFSHCAFYAGSRYLSDMALSVLFLDILAVAKLWRPLSQTFTDWFSEGGGGCCLLQHFMDNTHSLNLGRSVNHLFFSSTVAVSMNLRKPMCSCCSCASFLLVLFCLLECRHNHYHFQQWVSLRDISPEDWYKCLNE